MPGPHDSKEPSEAQNRPALSENFGFRYVNTRKEGALGQLPSPGAEEKVGVRCCGNSLSTIPLSTTLTQFAQFARSIYRVRQTEGPYPVRQEAGGKR